MCQHAAHFYADAYPAEAISDFFAAGLDVGDRCVALLTAPHRLAVEHCMRERGIVLEDVAYVAVDSGEAWARIQRAGRLDVNLAHELLAPFMMPPDTRQQGKVRAAGDLAPTLCAAGRTEDAVAFESIVHRLTAEHGASTICAYPIDSHMGGDGMRALLRLSAEHDVVAFPKRLWAHHSMRAALQSAWSEEAH